MAGQRRRSPASPRACRRERSVREPAGDRSFIAGQKSLPARRVSPSNWSPRVLATGGLSMLVDIAWAAGTTGKQQHQLVLVDRLANVRPFVIEVIRSHCPCRERTRRRQPGKPLLTGRRRQSHFGNHDKCVRPKPRLHAVDGLRLERRLIDARHMQSGADGQAHGHATGVMPRAS